VRTRAADIWVAGGSGRHFDYSGGEGTDQDRQAVTPAIIDSVTALLMSDLLERDDAETLYAGWETAVGRPALPAISDD
jgi:hypothetical protein